MRDAARQRIVAEIRTRRALMAMAGRRPRRPRPPGRQGQPDAVRLAYFSALLTLMEQARLRVAQASPELERTAAEHVKADAVRADAIEDVSGILDRLSREFFDQFTNTRLAAVAEEYARRTSSFQRQEISRQFQSALGVDVLRAEPWLEPKVREFTAENVALIKSIPQRYFTDVEKTVVAGMRQGLRWEEIAKQLDERYEVAEGHAKLVARDQVGKFMGELNEARQRELGVESFIWRTAMDNRVRESHAELEGETFRWDDPPVVDGEPSIPGEPINCRCQAEPVLEPLVAEIAGEPPAEAPAEPAPPPPEPEVAPAPPAGPEPIPAPPPELVDRLLAEARAGEPAATAAMRALEREGVRLEGLEFRLKGRESLTRKLLDEASERRLTLSQAAAQRMNDRLRYTLEVDGARYSTDVPRLLGELERRGYQVIRFTNTWGPGSPYQGVNVNLSTPQGVTMEVQLHTRESFHMKQVTNHPLYEEGRAKSTSEARERELTARMISNQAGVPVPAGAPQLTWRGEREWPPR